MKKIIAILVASIMICALTSVAFADSFTIGESQVKENLDIGDTFKNTEGYYERVIQVGKDGSFMTEVVDFAIQNSQKVACSHPLASLIPLAELDPDTQTVATKSVCFKYRSKTKCRCSKCNKIVYTYGPWKKHTKHSFFPLFGKKCKICGYTK